MKVKGQTAENMNMSNFKDSTVFLLVSRVCELKFEKLLDFIWIPFGSD